VIIVAAKKKGVLIVNLGSPDRASVFAVRRFLKQFLSDPRVVNLPRPLWWIILNFFILPFRPFKSVKIYREIWTLEGSPLIVLTQSLVAKVKAYYQKDLSINVKMAMSYGNPALISVLRKFKQEKTEQLIIIPLFPQYSSTTTASVFDAVTQELQQWRYIPELSFINDYHQSSFYIKAVSALVQKAWQQKPKNKLLLMSFHGLPEQLTKWGDPYFEQCHVSAKLIAEELGLKSTEWKIVFQSRFGRATWLQPYCVETLMKLPEQGFHSIDIVCPGFAVDCLETLEEINITNQAIFLDAGGRDYCYIPALNDTHESVELIVDLIESRRD
jgi:ferrochelatase